MAARPVVDATARARIVALESQAAQRDRDFASLSERLSRATADIARLVASVDSLTATVSSLTAPGSLPASSSGRAPAGFDSLILSDFPPLLADFGGSRFALLWRGSRDGFGAGDFHGRCDGHAETLTVILDTAGNIFGGFTPVAWDSRAAKKADPSLRIFLFTIKNPHGVPPSKFPLKPEAAQQAVLCDGTRGPGLRDISVADNCNAGNVCYSTNFGWCYENSTGLPGETFFTGAGKFTVREIEVFEITK
jgi:uncharacterized coiled-coil protein SlyX